MIHLLYNIVPLKTCNASLVMCNCLTSQRRTKQKVVTDFATLSKGTSAAARPRAALRQVLFNQGVSSDKNPVSEVLCCLLLVTLHADMHGNRYRLALTCSAHSNNCSICSAPLAFFFRCDDKPQFFITTVEHHFYVISDSVLFVLSVSLRSEVSWMCWNRIWRPTPCQSVWGGNGRRRVEERHWRRTGRI